MEKTCKQACKVNLLDKLASNVSQLSFDTKQVVSHVATWALCVNKNGATHGLKLALHWFCMIHPLFQFTWYPFLLHSVAKIEEIKNQEVNLDKRAKKPEENPKESNNKKKINEPRVLLEKCSE